MRLGSLHLCVSEILSVLVGRYFGSAEGSKFVEMASVDNVKRTWVNYGVAREWSNPTQGQVGGGRVLCWTGGRREGCVATTQVCELMHQT